MGDSKIKTVLEKYKKKFRMNLLGFKQFLETRVSLDVCELDIIINYVHEKNPEGRFNEQQLLFYLHVVAAVQSAQKIDSMNENDIKKFERILFLSKVKKLSMENSSRETMNPSQYQSEEQALSKQTSIFRGEEKKSQKKENEDSVIKPTKKTREQEDIQEHFRQNQKLKTIEEQRTEEISRDSRENEIFCQKNTDFQGEIRKNQIVIQKYEKMGQQKLNPIIKYEIRYLDKFLTWRRYSQIEKLMNYLHKKYEGILLPQMPPKQGIKGGITNFWTGVDEGFLLQRQEKLEILLNRLMECPVSDDQILEKFLKQQEFQIENETEDRSYMKTLTGLTQIVFSAKELKDYGMACYEYMWQNRNQPLNTEVSQSFEKIKELLSCIQETDRYRRKINQNFNRRRQIMDFMFSKQNKQKMKEMVLTDFDKLLEAAVIQSNELILEYNKYVQLKSTQNWLKYLRKQKKNEIKKSLQEDESKLKQRIDKMEVNLMKSICSFQVGKEKLLKIMGSKMIEWRIKVHP